MPPATERTTDALKFVAFSSLVKVDFWTELATRKLDTYRLNDEAQPIYGFYGSGRESKAPCRLNLLGESFTADTDEGGGGAGGRFEECRAMGYVKNVNTKEAFKDLDKPATLAAIARQIWADVVDTGRAVSEPERLLRFLLLTFADLKKSVFLHWFAFPTLGSQALFRLSAKPAPASSVFSPENATLVVQGMAQLWSRSVEKTGRPACPPFFVVVIKESLMGVCGDNDCAGPSVRVMSLLEHEEELGGGEEDGGKKNGHVYGFIDPCSEPGGMPGWPLRNFLAFLSARWGVKRARVLSFRDHVPRASPPKEKSVGGLSLDGANLDRSLVLDVDLSAAHSTKDNLAAAEATWLPDRIGSLGWEPNADGRAGPRMADLSSILNPSRLAENSVRLNIKLMRWRALPELDVDMLTETKCLLLGAGTLGCAVARCLMGWGVQHITFADNGRVAYSNPVRQSLFTFEDCKGGGRFKAEAAASALSTVYPGAKSKGHVLTIPMPGHPLAPGAETAKAKRDAENLEALVASHDVVFVLTDSRESRWLPTLLAAKHDTVCINAALGLDSFLVVRHGGAPDGELSKKAQPLAAFEVSGVEKLSTSVIKEPFSSPAAELAPRLGCYFCTDVVAPENSSLNRTLDQQCTVTRPGLAPMAAATAVEMTVGLLHHPLRQRAPADDSAGDARGLGAAQAAVQAGQGRHPLGALPHQVRGFIASFTTVTPSALAFDRCTACSAPVVAAHKSQGWEFVENACRSPQVLEDVSGLEELRKGLDALDLDLDWGVSDGSEDEEA